LGPKAPAPRFRFRFCAAFLWTATCRRHKFIAAINCNINLFYFNISHRRSRCRRLYRRRIILISRHLARNETETETETRTARPGLKWKLVSEPNNTENRWRLLFQPNRQLNHFYGAHLKRWDTRPTSPAVVSIGRCNLASDGYKWRERWAWPQKQKLKQKHSKKAKCRRSH